MVLVTVVSMTAGRVRLDRSAASVVACCGSCQWRDLALDADEAARLAASHLTAVHPRTGHAAADLIRRNVRRPR